MMTAGGVVFAWVCQRAGSLWPAIALHGFINFWLTLSTSATRSGIHVDVVGLAQSVSFVLALVLTARWRPARPIASPARLS